MPRTMARKNLLTSEQISEEFPLHMLVWFNKFEELNEKLTQNKVSFIYVFTILDIMIEVAVYKLCVIWKIYHFLPVYLDWYRM